MHKSAPKRSKLLKNILSRFYKNQSGIGLVEVIFALGVSIIIVTSLVSLTLFTMRSSLQNKLMLRGTQIVNQELETLRAFRDANSWEDFIDAVDGCHGSSKCYLDKNSFTVLETEGTEGTGVETVNFFFRAYDPNGGVYDPPSDSDSVVRIYANATWKIGSQQKNVHNYTDLSNWQEIY